MLDLSAKKDTIPVVCDEVNSVTYAPDLAAATRELLAARPGRESTTLLTPAEPAGLTSRARFSRIADRQVNTIPVASTHFPRKAARPARAILLNTKLPAIRPWQSALREFLAGE